MEDRGNTLLWLPLRSGKMGPLDENRLPSFTLFLIHQAEPCGGAAEGGAEHQSHAGGAQRAAPRGGHT
jgi:hypothetical protein